MYLSPSIDDAKVQIKNDLTKFKGAFFPPIHISG